MRRFAGAVLALSLCVGCSKSQTQPTAPSAAPAGGSGNAPAAVLEVKADAAGSRDAVASLSEVIVDASKSSGKGLTYAIDFGDGGTATTASATHVYAAPSTYTVGITVADAEGRKASATTTVTVRDATGSWFQAGYVAKSARVEVRRLTIDAQSGTTVRGSYRVTGEADRAFTGTLIPPRDIRLNADRGVMIEGTLPARLNDEATVWTLIPHGDSADGQRLDFKAIVGAPDAPPPVADIQVRFATPNGWAPIPAVTPVTVDGSGSLGTGLSYFVEFGDGGVATTSPATRVVDPKGDTQYSATRSATARLTIVDRFGRSDSRSRDYSFFVMPQGGGGDSWYTGPLGDAALWVTFPSRSGATYGVNVFRPGPYPHPGYGGSGSAVLHGYDDIRITIPALGIEYRGGLTTGRPPEGGVWLTLVQYGGPDDGRTWRLYMRSYS